VTRIVAFVNRYAIAVVLLVLVVLLELFVPSFRSIGNVQNILLQTSINSLLAIGATLTILTGGIDLSVGSIVGLTGIVAALLGKNPGGGPFVTALMAGIAAGLSLGAINGGLVAFVRIPPFVVTLGMMSIARSLAFVLSQGQPISDLSNEFLALGQGNLLGVPYAIIISVVAFVVFGIVLARTRFGRYIYAVGGNEEAARVSGVDTRMVKLAVYSLSGLLAGLGGVVLSARATAGISTNGEGYELTAIAAAVIGGTSLSGGRGSLLGTVAGVLIIGIMVNSLDLLNISPFYQGLIQGTIIIGAVAIDALVNRRR
jgi:ribose/xylose/arabinose/galactoside ABC-type transport system permease subunit